MNGLWMGRYLRRWNRNTLVARQPLTNDGPSGAIAAAPQQPLLVHRRTPSYPSMRTAERATPDAAARRPGARAMIKQGGENEIDRRIFRGARPSALDKLSTGSADQHDCGPLSWERTPVRETPLPRDGYFLPARGKFCANRRGKKKRRVTGEIHCVDMIRSCQVASKALQRIIRGGCCSLIIYFTKSLDSRCYKKKGYRCMREACLIEDIKFERLLNFITCS